MAHVNPRPPYVCYHQKNPRNLRQTNSVHSIITINPENNQGMRERNTTSTSIPRGPMTIPHFYRSSRRSSGMLRNCILSVIPAVHLLFGQPLILGLSGNHSVNLLGYRSYGPYHFNYRGFITPLPPSSLITILRILSIFNYLALAALFQNLIPSVLNTMAKSCLTVVQGIFFPWFIVQCPALFNLKSSRKKRM